MVLLSRIPGARCRGAVVVGPRQGADVLRQWSDDFRATIVAFVSLRTHAVDKQRALRDVWRKVRQVSRWQRNDSPSDHNGQWRCSSAPLSCTGHP